MADLRGMVDFRLSRMRVSALVMMTFAVTALTLCDAYSAPLMRWENRRENGGAFRVIPELTYMSTNQNFDETGKKLKASGEDIDDSGNRSTQDLSAYTRTQLDFMGVYGYSPNLTAFARLSVASSTFETVSQESTAAIEGLQGSAAGLGDQALGANYRFMEFGKESGKRPGSVDFQVQIDFPLYNTDANRKEQKPLQGDGTIDFTLGPFVTYPITQGPGNRWYLIGGLGYTARTKSYSAVLPYQLSAAMLPEKEGLMVRAGIYGNQAMASDKEGEIKLADGSTTRDAGGSLIVDALNSSYLALRGIVGYQSTGATQYYAGITYMMMGKSTAALTALHVGAQFRWAKAPASADGSARGAIGPGKTRAAQLRYDLQASVRVAKPQLKVVQIDRGSADGVAVGQTFDFYRKNEQGGYTLVARGKVEKIGSKASNIRIQNYYEQAWIQPGFVARRIAQ